ncbi:hypothetical protein GJV06_10760 [Enterobacteriaceae bacterium RIT691]|nr:hypothetical protein [Enterobacteriaceae bacterium RIT691]
MRLPDALRAMTDKIEDITRSTVEATVKLAQEIQQSVADQPGSSTDMFLLPSVKSVIQQHIKTSLSQTPYCSGAGFASHIASTPTTQEFWVLEWWYKRADGVEQVNLDLDQATQQRLDFRTFEWFRHSPPDGQAYIHGPYVDYICNTSYTLTSAVPVYSKGQFMGVAAIDMLVSRIEDELLATPRQQPVVLTNLDKRIFFSTLPRYRVGDLLDTSTLQQCYESDYFRLYQK